MNEEIKLHKRLEELRHKHRSMDEQIQELIGSPLNQLVVMRLKKEKLTLRDLINDLERQLYPDLIA